MSSIKSPTNQSRVNVKNTVKPTLASSDDSSRDSKNIKKEKTIQIDKQADSKSQEGRKQEVNSKPTPVVVDLTGLDHPNDKPSRATVYRLKKQAAKENEIKANPDVQKEEENIIPEINQEPKKKNKEIEKPPKKKKSKGFCGLLCISTVKK